jgi:hypothetical protein
MSHAQQLHNRRYFNDSMESIHRQGLPGNVKRALGQHGNAAVVATTRRVIETGVGRSIDHAFRRRVLRAFALGTWPRADAQRLLRAGVDHAIRPYGRLAGSHTAPGQRQSGVADEQPLRALLGAVSRPAGEALRPWAASARPARVEVRDAWRGVVTGLVPSQRFGGGPAG